MIQHNEDTLPLLEAADKTENCGVFINNMRSKASRTAVVVVAVLLMSLPSKVEMKYLGPKLSRLVMNDATGIVYVGGENRLYQLDDDLNLLIEAKTGPQLDNDQCFVPVENCPHNLTYTNNFNKVLVLDKQRGNLITCGSLFQGRCEARSLVNVSRELPRSDGTSVVDVAVVANDETSSSQAFIAPGPRSHMGTVLYTAATYSAAPGSVLYRRAIPALARRSLNKRDRFFLAENKRGAFSRNQISALFLNEEIMPTYPIHYVAGFSNEGFSYFLTVQRETTSQIKQGRFISKIVQVCNEDSLFVSSAEIPLRCTSENPGAEANEDYNVLQAARVIHPGDNLARDLFIDGYPGDVLVGVFTRDNSMNHGAGSARGGSTSGSHAGSSKRRRSGDGGDIDSALCVFTMAEIRAKLLENIKLCHQGNTSVNGRKYYKGAGKCDMQSGPIVNNVENERAFMCNTLETFSNVVGLRPVIKRPVISYPGLKLTAVALTVVNQFTVAFLGTADGRVKKVILGQSQGAFEYAEQVVSPEGSAILSDLHFNREHRMLYALTSTNITRIPVESCEEANTCSDCLSDGDPYCGWCSLENKCGLRDSCPNSQDPTAGRWLQGTPSQCIYITSIEPSTASVTKAHELYLTITPQGVLPMTSAYTCVFLELGWSSPASLSYNGATCNTSDFRQLGLSLGAEPFKTVTLALNSSETGKLFVTKNFTFYNCSNFYSCTSCTNSSFACDWCVEDNGCFDDTSKCKANIVHGKRSLMPGMKGPRQCPQIDTGLTKSIFLPSGVKRTVVLKGSNIPELRQNTKNYECILQLKSGQVIAPAKRHDDQSITCEIPPLNYKEDEGSIEANLSVYWGDRFWLESSETLVATVYKCNVLARQECSLCVNLNYTRPELECFWCQGSCLHSSSCDRYSGLTTCPAPHIESVWPLSGSVKGGTNVTIEGSNLGAKFEDIQNAVTVANVKCVPFRSLYMPSKRIVCQTRWRGQVASGPVIVKIGRTTSQFRKNFHFKSPRLEDIEPNVGPRSGGTVVTIKGRNMDTGLKHEAMLGSEPCTVIKERTTNSSIQCITSKVWRTGSKNPVIVKFDENSYTLNKLFTYKDDPTITGIAPLDSILAGGRVLTVKGSEFSYIQQPRMFAYIPTITADFYRTDETLCQVMNNFVMKCPTPPLVEAYKNIIRSRRSAYSLAYPDDPAGKTKQLQPIQVVHLAFVMDDVQSVQNLSGLPQLDSKLRYFPNPQVFNFTESGGVKVLKGDALIIEGSNLNTAAEQNEVSVMIGQSPCNVTTFSQSQIVCKLPATQPQGESSANGNSDGKSAPWVKVKINNLEFHVGRVEYDVPETFAFPTEAIAGICAGGGFLLLIIILILIIYRRQSTMAERINNKLQLQLENLESNVRNECKQAFAELQTDMTDLTADLISSGIPFWDFHSYAFKVLFPGMTDHIILHPPIKKNGRFQFSDHGLQTFHQLLGTKVFMMTFIKTLEEQKSFSIRDKANVASLLMIVYLNNMEYATEILKSLLEDLVQKSVDGKHPKLMLRRSESVVEKLLTNWLSVCLYRYLREYAGASLFMLYKAIKLQAEKGPVDFVTGDARYSLSEDTLLREKIEPKMLTLNVESGTGEIFQVRVPDCDTITQTKEKIMDHLYKNIPFSQRPPVKELELEWRNGPTGPLILSNIDIASYNKEGWRRLNTLAFYRVHDGAYMMLLHRHSTLKSMNGSLDNSVLSIGSVSPILRKEESGFKEWHLVKHDDTLIKDGGVKMISEIFLTRLLSTKGTLQKYIDDFFNNILSASHELPEVVKYLFDFLDLQAEKHGISDLEVVHTWKCNSLPLRFWVNIIKNPDFVFDINKPRIVDSCLSVVAQTFMDSCSTSEHRLGKDSPSNKLLFAKDIVQYRKLVEKFFTDVRKRPEINEQQMKVFLGEISRQPPKLFYISSALGELYKYISKYKKELMEALEQDNQAKAMQLSSSLGHMVTCIEGPSGEMAFV